MFNAAPQGRAGGYVRAFPPHFILDWPRNRPGCGSTAMKRYKVIAAVAMLAATPALAQAPAAPADPRYVWDLTELYPGDAAWDAERTTIADALPGLSSAKGSLGRDSASLAKALRAMSDVKKRLERLYT